LSAPRLVIGCDFTSRPSRRKPIVLACGHLCPEGARLARLLRFDRFDAFEAWLADPARRWVGGFDLPFGLPRELVRTLGWPLTWRACIEWVAALPRERLREQLVAFCAARPAGAKFAHRATDRPAGSSPSMKWVNPPVVYMLHAGVPLLLRAGAHFPGLHGADESRVALEAYPGLLARSVLGRRSYKADARERQTPERRAAREALLAAAQAGEVPLLRGRALALGLTAAQRQTLIDDASGDSLDAALCLLQAAWAQREHEAGHPNWGLPPFDPLEGWIVGAAADGIMKVA